MTNLKQRIGDFETASGCNLKKAGAARYAQDVTTEVLCFAWGAPGTEPFVWFPWMGPDDPITQRLTADALDPLTTWIAHNAGFEKAIWHEIMVPVYGFPEIANSQWHDTMAVCARKSIPLDLDMALRVLGLPNEKDMAGSKFTIGLSKPDKKTGYLDRSPEAYERVGAYCAQDIRVEGALHHRMGWLEPGERKVWLLDQEINARGVALDLEFVRKAQEIVAKASVPLAAEFQSLTGLNVGQNAKVVEWVREQGVALPNMQKQTLIDLLGADEDGEEPDEDAGALEQELPQHVARALRIRQLIGSASIKKLDAMRACVCEDGRAHGLLQYYGAGTGRWAGRLLQPQNFPRGSLREYHEDIDAIVAGVLSGDPDFLELVANKPAVEAIVSSLRQALVAGPGRVFVSGDFAQIEARVLLALAGQYDKVDILASGKSPYIDMGWKIYGRELNKHLDVAEYTISKNSVLGLGFQMGAQKFHDRYAKTFDMEFCQSVVDIYRKDWAPKVPPLWYGLEHAAVETVHTGRPHEAYGVQYSLADGWLVARMPNGRCLYYYNPQPIFKAMPWDELDVRPAFTYQAKKLGRWITIDAYGGLLTENVVQALARDLLVSAMFRCRAEGIPIVLTVHDETLGEPLTNSVTEQMMNDILCDSPPWARDMRIPVAADTWIGDRYRK